MVTLVFPRLDLQPLPWFILSSQGLDPAKQRFGGYHHFSGYVGKEVFLSVPLFLIPIAWFCDYTAIS